MREVWRSILYIGMVPVILGLLLLYVWVGEAVRAAAVELEDLRRVEMTLRNRQNALHIEQSRLTRPDHLARMATQELSLVQPDPQPREIHVVLP